MQVHYGLDNINIKNAVITVGSFDGIHKGHAKVLDLLKDCAKRQQGKAVLVTFDPHPREVLFPNEKSLGLLTSMQEKIELLDSFDLDHLIVLTFDLDLARLSYIDFVQHILIDKLDMRALVIGYDHRFGKNREGSFVSLENLSAKNDFHIERQDAYQDGDVNVSSTKIRDALKVGDIEKVNTYLVQPYSIIGKVIMGDRIGTSLGFPTANIVLSDSRKLLPPYGVYAVNVVVDNDAYTGMLNIGMRPTISHNGEERIEVHIFDFADDLYTKEIKVIFIKRIRGERRFDSLAELQEQMKSDKIEINSQFLL